LDKAEILAALNRLHDKIGNGSAAPERLGRVGIGCPLAILVTKRESVDYWSAHEQVGAGE